ncbi:hypothetical protein [Collimonas sp.]|jgi:hypothetical protein|uniref:hypothetical protein n=1 Tax=Collimonas sp. TaxID=1963772 RepID=UPI002BA095B0|nr:hypothetical protein [Collimonas sp.]HWW07881.1 hypothetical protein [Collimonas sp.]
MHANHTNVFFATRSGDILKVSKPGAGAIEIPINDCAIHTRLSGVHLHGGPYFQIGPLTCDELTMLRHLGVREPNLELIDIVRH